MKYVAGLRVRVGEEEVLGRLRVRRERGIMRSQVDFRRTRGSQENFATSWVVWEEEDVCWLREWVGWAWVRAWVRRILAWFWLWWRVGRREAGRMRSGGGIVVGGV